MNSAERHTTSTGIDSDITPYDEVLYPSKSVPQTHPDRLATVATLFGMSPTPIDNCRVLELGCGDGANLIPMASNRPRSEFLGVDLAAKPISSATQFAEALKLTNIRFLQADVSSLDASLGRFDYIIAHGLYSWVPTATQGAIFDLCRRLLTQNGLAYISYNVYPGWHLGQTLRGMILFHTAGIITPTERIRAARELIAGLDSVIVTKEQTGAFLSAEYRRLLQADAAYLYHEHMAEVNLPEYFSHVASRAQHHGLQYVGEARFADMREALWPGSLSSLLEKFAGGNRILREQYVDFATCRSFRQSIFCRSDASLQTSPNSACIASMWAASPATPTESLSDLTAQRPVKFEVGLEGPWRGGKSVELDYPPAKLALFRLGQEWPRSVSFKDLAANVSQALSSSRPESAPDHGNTKPGPPQVHGEETLLCDVLLRLYGADFIDLHLYPPRFVTTVSEKPVASPVARLQARRGRLVCNLCQRPLSIDGELARTLLVNLDGHHDRHALIDLLQPLRPGDDIAKELDSKLKELASLALLES